jgi:hypothetical protein
VSGKRQRAAAEDGEYRKAIPSVHHVLTG